MIITFPTSEELSVIQQELLPTLIEDDIIFTYFPMTNHDAALVEWEQKDNFFGLMQIRGYDAQPPSVPNVGYKKYRMDPGVYGEHAPIPESELTTRRVPGTFATPINLDAIVLERTEFLLNRRIDRIRWVLWTLITAGVFTVLGVNGQILHAGGFAIQKTTATIPWTTVATATPLADLRALILLYAGRSFVMGPNARILMNRNTFIQMMLNTNANDIGGKKLIGGANYMGTEDVNKFLIANDMPPIEIYERGYDTVSGTFARFLPDGKVVVIGQRPNGETVGEWQFTRNAGNEDFAPGPYTRVTDSLDQGMPYPRTIRVDDGFNGGPALQFPGAVIVLTAYT